MSQEDFPRPENSFSSVSAEDFIKYRDALHSDLFAFLTPHTKGDYDANETRLFLSEDLKSGFGINPDGELISVFALEKGRGKVLVAEARKRGALYLSCMGEHLLKLYSEFDFSPVEVTKWDNQFAPKNWNYERFGMPNIYDMKLINPYIKKFEGGL
jgi:hypothetical protein